MHELHLPHLRTALAVAWQARERGNHPFGAILVDGAGTVRLTAENTVNTCNDCTGHAELNLVRLAWQQLDHATLASCTLYTSTEPCAMCAGAIHWSGIGRVVFALSAATLWALVSSPAEQTRFLACREVFERYNPALTVIGPLIEDEARVVHQGFWGNQQ